MDKTQIENATRFIQYDTIINPSNESCPFTYEPFNNQDMVRQILFCGHICSSAGFNTWFNSNVSCPICRYDIRNYRPTSIFNNEDLVSTLPAPTSTLRPTSSSSSSSSERQPNTSSESESQVMDNDDITDFMIRNYLGFWYDISTIGATNATTPTTTTPTPTTTPTTTTTPRRNIVYYTIRNLDR